MYSTYIYLDKEDMKKLNSGDSIEINVTQHIRNSDSLLIRINLDDEQKG